MIANTQTDVKVNNQKAILEYLLEHGATSRADIAKGISSSKPTVSKNVEELLEKGLLEEVGKGDNSLGKKGLLLDINCEYASVLAVDLSKNAIRFQLCNLRKQEKTSKIYQYNKVENAKELLMDFFADSSESIQKLGKVVVAYPGVIAHNGSFYLSAIKEREAVMQELVEALKKTVSCDVIVKNDINLSVLAEQTYNTKLQAENLYYMSFDSGVGAGIMIHGKLYEGDRNAAGEVGFILRNKNQREDSQEYQTLEERVSLGAIMERYRIACGKTLTSIDEFSELVQQKNELAEKLYQSILEDISVAISNVTSVLDIETVVVAGAVMKISADMRKDIEDRINAMSPFQTAVMISEVETAAVKGCILYGIQSFFSELWNQ